MSLWRRRGFLEGDVCERVVVMVQAAHHRPPSGVPSHAPAVEPIRIVLMGTTRLAAHAIINPGMVVADLKSVIAVRFLSSCGDTVTNHTVTHTPTPHTRTRVRAHTTRCFELRTFLTC